MILAAATPYAAHWLLVQLVRLALWSLRGVRTAMDWALAVLERIGLMEQEGMDAATA